MAWTILLSDADISTLTTLTAISAGTEARLTASFCNRSASATATVQLWVVPSGETRGNEHLKEAGTTLGLAGTPQAVLERSFVAPAGCVVYVQASTANVSCQVQGDVVSVSVASSTIDIGAVTFLSTWTDYSVATSLKRYLSTVVCLNLSAQASGPGPSSSVCTLPSGFRPVAEIFGAAGLIYDSSAGITKPAKFNIATDGTIVATGLTGTSEFSVGNGDIVNLSIVFFNA